jgi:hypothetical protein
MLAIYMILTPGHQNEFIDFPTATVQVALLHIMKVKTQWNSMLELLECAYQL